MWNCSYILNVYLMWNFIRKFDFIWECVVFSSDYFFFFEMGFSFIVIFVCLRFYIYVVVYVIYINLMFFEMVFYYSFFVFVWC